MHSTASRREVALDAVEESIRETLEAQAEYLAAWDAQWRERVASNFASLTKEQGESASRDLQHGIFSGAPDA